MFQYDRVFLQEHWGESWVIFGSDWGHPLPRNHVPLQGRLALLPTTSSHRLRNALRSRWLLRATSARDATAPPTGDDRRRRELRRVLPEDARA